MPKYISEKDLNAIASLLTGRPAGWRIGEIEKQLTNQGLQQTRKYLFP
jgi:hypothetical protein